MLCSAFRIEVVKEKAGQIEVVKYYVK